MGCDGTYPSVGEEWRTGAVDDITAANIAKRKSCLIMVSNKGNSVTDVKVKDFSDYWQILCFAAVSELRAVFVGSLLDGVLKMEFKHFLTQNLCYT